MAAKLSNAGKPKSLINSFLPGLISFGCAGLFNGFYRAFDGVRGWHDPFTFAFAAIGIIMLALGLAALFVNQQRLERRLDELERLKS